MMALVRMYRRLPESVRARVWYHRVLPDEIHIENITETFEKTFRFLQKRPTVMMFLTFSKHLPYNLQVKKCYQKLLDALPNTVGLHVHFCSDFNSPAGQLPPADILYEHMEWARYELDKLLMIQKGHKHPYVREFCSGQWNYNLQLIEMCKMFYLTRIHMKTKYINDFTAEWGWPSGVELVPVIHNIHDFDL